MLIPMFLIIGIWGGPRRVYATIKFFLYTFLGSVFMLVALIYMYVQGAATTRSPTFQALPLTLVEQRWIFVAFLLAFAVKVPMWPVHTWLPDAHVEAPTGGSVILAAIMLKMGGYGFLRFSLPIAPDASRELDMLMIALSLIAVVYIGFVALVQQDMKKLIAYSSIAHMGFVTLGAFIVYDIVAQHRQRSRARRMGMDGAMVQMISHGLISGRAVPLRRRAVRPHAQPRDLRLRRRDQHHADVRRLHGAVRAGEHGLPGTSGFVGEFLVILASFKANFWYAFLAGTTLVLGAAYTLWLVKRVIFGPVANDQWPQLEDLNGREFLVLGVLAARGAAARRVAGAAARHVMQASIHHLVDQAVATKLPL